MLKNGKSLLLDKISENFIVWQYISGLRKCHLRQNSVNDNYHVTDFTVHIPRVNLFIKKSAKPLKKEPSYIGILF